MKQAALVLLAALSACGGPSGDRPQESYNAPRKVVDDAQERRDQARLLGDDPHGAARSTGLLLRFMNDPDAEVRWRAEFAIGRAGAEAVEDLARSLRSEDPKIRASAAYVLGPIGRKARAAVPDLLARIEDKETAVRVWSVKALGDVDPDHPDCVAAYVKTLRDPDPDVRRVTIANLIKIGWKGAAAVPALIDVLQDADAGIRWRACLAFRQMGSDAKNAVPALIGKLGDPDRDVRDRAAQALARIGVAGAPALQRALRERDANVRRLSAEILGTFGIDARTASTELDEAAKDADPGVQAAAALAAKKVRGEAAEASTPAPAAEPAENVDRRSAWYKWAKFGLFVHWGLYSVPARARPGTLAEWAMDNEKIPVREYERFALKFGAEKFDGKQWARMANETGCRYLVITAKHHDGFCLWNSKDTEYTSQRLAVARKDLLAELGAACEKEGVKFCAYYSMLDWHHPEHDRDFPKYVDYLHKQVEELLTNYPVWGMWFDGEWGRLKDEWRGNDLIATIRRIRPQAFINDRLGRETRGTISGVDFYTKEQEIPSAALRLQNRPVAWETCQTFGTSWGWNESPDPLKSGERIIEQLVDVVSKGGNFLLNVGPRPDGTIPEPFIERMKIIGAWLKKNGEAIYDTERSPFGGPIPAGRVTSKGRILYVFLEELPRSGILEFPGLKNKIEEAWLVDGRESLKVRDGNRVDAPGRLLDRTFTVVGIQLDAPPVVQK